MKFGKSKDPETGTRVNNKTIVIFNLTPPIALAASIRRVNKCKMIKRYFAIILVLFVFIRYGIVEIAVWNDHFRRKVFLVHSPLIFRYYFLDRLKPGNSELLYKVSECYDSMVTFYETRKIVESNPKKIRALNTAYDAAVTVYREKANLKIKQRHYKIVGRPSK